MNNDERWIKESIRLARKGGGRVSPNPMVGAVLVRDGDVLSKGYHHFYGDKHAEIDCLDRCKEDPSGATMFVNLEPCSHHGKTPPCTDRILESGIKRVVCGMKDPNPLVSGKGIRRLRSAGVRVRTAVCETECTALNQTFIKLITTGLPFIHLKVAQTIDGKITGRQRWITGREARTLVHRWRGTHDAVLVGAGTVITDDPLLDVRLANGRSPAVILLDGRLRIPLRSRLLHTASIRPVYLLTTRASLRRFSRKANRLREMGTMIISSRGKGGRFALLPALKAIGQSGIASVLVEGGADVFGGFMENGLVDRLSLFVSPDLSGDGLPAFSYLSAGDARGLQPFFLEDQRRTGRDLLITYKRR